MNDPMHVAEAAVLPFVPVEGADVIEILTNDHRRIAYLLHQILEESYDPDKRSAHIQHLRDNLTIHNATEENLVYPSVRTFMSKTSLAAELYHEQDEAKLMLFDATEMSEDVEKLKQFVKVLDHAITSHVYKEEEEVFPALRRALSAESLAKLTAEVRAFRTRFR